MHTSFLNFKRFTHARIRPFFTGCGKAITATLNDIIEGRLSVEDLPMITVLENNGFYFSLNNRRLYVLKALREGGYLESKNNLVKVRLKVPLQREIERYNVERCCLQAKIMTTKRTTESSDLLDSTGNENDADDMSEESSSQS